jgi:hypothetical protein
VSEPSPAALDDFRGRVSVPEHVAHRSFQDQVVLLNLQTGQYHGLDPTGGRMLELLEETGSAHDVASRLAEEYGVPWERIAADVATFCAGLRERGLLELEETGRGK